MNFAQCRKYLFLFFVSVSAAFADTEPTLFHINKLPRSVKLYSKESITKGAKTILALDEIPPMHALDEKTAAKGYAKLDEVFNFRHSKDRTAAGFSQPSKNGIQNILEFLGSGKSGKNRTVYFDLREEPVLFINGKSYGFRELDKQNKNLFITGITPKELDELERAMKEQIIQASRKNGGKIAVKKEVKEGAVSVEEIMIGEKNLRTTNETFQDVVSQGFQVSFYRIPITDEHAPQISDVNSIVKIIDENKGARSRTFHCHLGHGRTTTGLTMASIIDKAPVAHPEKDGSTDAEAIRKIAAVGEMAKALRFTGEDYALINAATNENNISIDLRKDVLAKMEKGTSAQFQATLKRYLTLMALTKYARSPERKKGMGFTEWLDDKPRIAKLIE
ncbi:MAG: hypothetical protein HYW49_00215 [Deltaproteobacteria bacterium]|nr:hypothetical protein [Deltaproteobacteria bacterium]